MSAEGRPTNHLRDETSPYLLQHARNPVDWHPWGERALALARERDCPILLSIGYAACHWCHVMERETFENDAIADLLNRHFVAVKVDREERPDLDEIYMHAVQLMTGQGGWPLNVFLTPDLRPFTGGTYFPPRSRQGRIGFGDLLEGIQRAWSERREEVERAAAGLTDDLRNIADGPGAADAAQDADALPGAATAARATAELAARFDDAWGGFGAAPKFPPDGALALLLLEHARTGEPAPLGMARATLRAMALGGLYDHVGGGFCRYSTDRQWLVPHFEKMLYNQALLVPVYLDAWLIDGDPLFRRVVEQSLEFVRRELTGPEGGLLCSLDADSEGEEGAFYLWDPAEVHEALGENDGALVCEVYGIRPGGNFEGRSIPNLLGGSLAEQAERRGTSEQELERRLAPLRARLLATRERRPRPATDDKVLTAWNGLMISAFARAARALGRSADLESARRAARFVLDELLVDGRLRVTWRDGRARLNAYLDDHAFLARGLVDLYEADGDPRWLDAAAGAARLLVEHFEDASRGGFHVTSDDHERLIARGRSMHDGALPSGGGVACEALLRLATHLDDGALRRPAERALAWIAPAIDRMPSAFASWLLAADRAVGPGIEVAIVGPADDPATRRLRAVIDGRFLPRLTLAIGSGAATDSAGAFPLLRGRTTIDGAPAAYVCRGSVCRRPVAEAAELAAQLDEELRRLSASE